MSDPTTLVSPVGSQLSVERPVSHPIAQRKRVSLLGCPVDQLSLEETVDAVNALIATRQPHQHCVVNAGKFVLMHRDSILKEIVQNCGLINADGQSVVWALKLLGTPVPSRVTGIDLMERLFAEAHTKRYRVFFLGSKQDVLDSVLEGIKRNFPHLVVAGSHDGYFHESEETSLVEKINAASTDILFVAMGSPKKEYWLGKYTKQLKVPFCMGVGGSFDVVAGKVKRAPDWMQHSGLEWFFRWIQEPIRLWRRYWIDNFVFVYLVLMSSLKVKVRLKKASVGDLQEKEIT